jgi:hypothetical protein
MISTFSFQHSKNRTGMKLVERLRPTQATMAIFEIFFQAIFSHIVGEFVCISLHWAVQCSLVLCSFSIHDVLLERIFHE